MRARTAITLGTVVAGAVLAGVGGSAAAFTDAQSVPVSTLGASTLGLQVTPTDPVRLRPGNPATFTMDRSGSAPGAAVLSVSVVDGADSDACVDFPAAKVVVSIPGDATPVRTTLCELVQAPETVARFSGGLHSVPLTVKVNAPAGQSSGGSWDGVLHFVLKQAGGGFSDDQDVAATVTVPAQG